MYLKKVLGIEACYRSIVPRIPKNEFFRVKKKSRLFGPIMHSHFEHFVKIEFIYGIQINSEIRLQIIK